MYPTSPSTSSVRSPAMRRGSVMGNERLPGISLEEGDLPSIPMGGGGGGGGLVRYQSVPNSSMQQQQQHTTTSPATRLKAIPASLAQSSRIFDDPAVTAGYNAVPTLEQDELPRGGVTVETAAVGRIQFGIPPETIKDSMLMGMEVPRVYIVPTDCFCSDLGPALGINLAEFEFPAYFNYFVRRKRVCLVVDSKEAENNIRSVFEETLLGPKQFRDDDNPLANDDADFDPDFPVDARPNFFLEFQYFRVSEKTDQYDELTIDMLLDFHHFDRGSEKDSSVNEFIGVPPLPRDEKRRALSADETVLESSGMAVTSLRMSMQESDLLAAARKTRFAVEYNTSPQLTHASSPHKSSLRASRRASLESVESMFSSASGHTIESVRSDSTATHQPWKFSQLQWLGEVATVWPMDATPQQIANRSVPRVEIFKMPGSGTEYVIHDVDEDNTIVGKARLRGRVHVPDEIALEGFHPSEDEVFVPASVGAEHVEDHTASSIDLSMRSVSEVSLTRTPPKMLFHPPSFGLTVLGNSHGFDKNGSTSGYVVWINGRGIMIDPPPYASSTLEKEGIRPQMIFGIMITHCHADHDAGAFQKILTGSRLTVITTPTIYNSFIRKYSALSGLSPTLLQQSHRFRAAIIGKPLKFQGATFHFTYTLHTIPCISFKVEWRGRSMVFTGDHLNNPPLLDELEEKVRESLLCFIIVGAWNRLLAFCIAVLSF